MEEGKEWNRMRWNGKEARGRFLFFGFGAWMPRKVVRKSLVDRERLGNRFFFFDMGTDFYVQQIIRVLDRIGYVFAEEQGLTIFVPRDNNAIVVAESELIPDSLSYKVLEYNHHSLKGDIEAKREILVKLASVLESQDKKLNSISLVYL